MPLSRRTNSKSEQRWCTSRSLTDLPENSSEIGLGHGMMGYCGRLGFNFFVLCFLNLIGLLFLILSADFVPGPARASTT